MAAPPAWSGSRSSGRPTRRRGAGASPRPAPQWGRPVHRRFPLGQHRRDAVRALEALLIDAVADPIPAQAGWVAELWIGDAAGNDPELLGVYPVLAWEPEPNTSFDDYPRGHTTLVIPERDERLGIHSGPVSTRDLPGVARYRREDAPPFAGAA